MESNFRPKRILREIQLFREAFPNSNITHKDLTIVITEPNFKCIIELPLDWPFKSPLVLVNYNNYAYYQPPMVGWNPAMDIRTIYYDVLDTIKDGFYKNFERIQDKVDKVVDSVSLDKVNKVINLITSVDIDKLKINYPNIEVKYCKITNSQNISLDNLIINISFDEINVYENENDWPEHMIPNYSTNIFDIVDEIWYIKISNQTKDPTDYILKCKHSLSLHFDHVDYNEHHQTFIINSLKYLIIIGININSQYLPPMVMVYSKGTILSVSYDFSNWNPDNLGKIITEALTNYETS